MRFSGVFKKSISDFKRAGAILWLLSLGIALLSTVPILTDGMNSAVGGTSTIIEQEGSLEGYPVISGNPAETITLDLNNSEVGNQIMSQITNMLGSALLFMVPMLLIGILIVVTIGGIIGALLNYFLSVSALEVVEDRCIDKGRNLGSVICAQILLGLMTTGLAFLLIGSLFGGLVTFNIWIAIIGPLISVIGMIYIGLKYSATYYVSAKYSNLKGMDILKRASKISKGNKAKIMGYFMLIAFIVALVSAPFSVLGDVFISNAGIIGVFTAFILETAIETCSGVLLIMFSMNMFSRLDNTEEPLYYSSGISGGINNPLEL